MDIWKSEKWKTFYNNKKVRTGLYTRFDNRIPPEIKWPCYMFCEWVREYYEFPIIISGSMIFDREIQR